MKIKQILITALVLMVGALSFNTLEAPREAVVGSGLAGSAWTVINSFSGYQTKVDPAKVQDGANPQGQNTTSNDGDRISLRKEGLDIFPEGGVSATMTPIKSLHTFRKRDGSSVMIRAYGTEVEYFDEFNNSWERLATSTNDSSYGFADYNINTDLSSYVYFGNGVNNFRRWNGSITQLNGAVSAGTTTITVDSTLNFTAAGSIIYCGSVLAYTSKTNTTFTVATTTETCADNKAIAQYIVEYPSNPKGNIYLVANNRLFISGIASTSQAVYFSAYGDATTFAAPSGLVTSTTAASAGIFNLGEGGGAVTAMRLDEISIYMFKRSVIYKATLSDSLYSLAALKPFDGKSQTSGAINNNSTFTGGNGVFLVTPDNQIMSLERVEQVDYPQSTAISDIIKNTADGINFNGASGIVYRDKAYISAKTDMNSTNNDVVLVWNIKNANWESPIVGWNANVFTVYDDGTGESLYLGSSDSINVYKVVNTSQDGDYGVKANWRSKQFDFGVPHQQKELSNVYIEGYIKENTTLKISLLLNEDGYTQKFSTDFVGTETSYEFFSGAYNVIGLTPFGTERFGSNKSVGELKKFRVYLNKDFRASPFYNAQIEFASEGDNYSWEITGFGFEWRPYTEPTSRNLYRSFK